MRRLTAILAVCYPLLVHAAVITRSPALTAASLAWLSALILLPALARGNALAWFAAVAAGAAAALAPLMRQSWMWLPLYAPSVLADFFGAWIFGHTLTAGRVPLISRLVRLLHPPDQVIEPVVLLYARNLTLAWAVLLLALGVANLVLACCAAPDGVLLLLGVPPPFTVAQRTWSLFANVLEYVIVVAFFVIEYGYRQRRFPQQPYPNMIEFMRRMLAVAPRAVAWRPPPGSARGGA
ncbi:MAG TPA: hypothetical protein VMG11_13315 [Steroidobacteraceae bacterium]|nr:hypothetical protein [Steroidobacteraceae bacterium]